MVGHRVGTINANANRSSRYPLPSTMGALAVDWNKGYIMAPVFYFAMMACAADPLHVTKDEKEIWDNVEVLRLLQTHKYGNGLSAKTRDCIYK